MLCNYYLTKTSPTTTTTTPTATTTAAQSHHYGTLSFQQERYDRVNGNPASRPQSYIGTTSTADQRPIICPTAAVKRLPRLRPQHHHPVVMSQPVEQPSYVTKYSVFWITVFPITVGRPRQIRVVYDRYTFLERDHPQAATFCIPQTTRDPVSAIIISYLRGITIQVHFFKFFQIKQKKKKKLL